MQEAPPELQRRQRYANLFGEPVQVPTEAGSTWPACAVPTICGGVRFVGTAAGGVPAAETAALGAEAADALPAAEAAVATTWSACPTSSLTGRYDSAVAPK